MSIKTDYLSLSKGARWHLKPDTRGRYYLISSRQVKWIIVGAITLLVFSSSLLMTFLLSGREQVFYAITTVILLPFVVLALGVRNHLMFDPHQGLLLHSTRWWGLFKRESPGQALEQVSVTVAPIAELSEGCQLEMSEQRFTIGTFEQTCQLALFLCTHFGVRAVDRVTAWPEEKQLDAVPPDRCLAPAEGVSLRETPATPYRTVWEQHVMLKLALPFPLFVVLGAVLMLTGNQGG